MPGMGLTLAIGASLSFVALDVLRKILGRGMRASDIVVGINLGAALVLGTVVAVDGVPEFDRIFAALALLEGATFALASVLYVRAVTLSPLSLTIPYLGFTPLIAAGVALILLGEVPSPRGWSGIFLVVAGGLLLHRDGRLSPARLLTAPLREPGSWRMLIVAAIWGITTSIDKIAIAHGSEALLGFSISLVSALLLLGLRTFQGRSSRRRRVEPPVRAPLLYLAAGVAGVAVLCQFYAYRYLLVSYVEAIKRGGGLLSVLIGIWGFEEGGLLQRLPAAILMLLGMLLIAL
jgi:drug/metabolite transporter (DMT)-like permease